MCYSAMVEQSVRSLGLRFQARIQLDRFEELFQRRLTDERIRIPKGMERDFLAPNGPQEERIRDAILAFRRQEQARLEAERERQRDRLDAATRALAARPTKKAEAERRIATSKLGALEQRLADLWRDRPEGRDARIFPRWYAPVVAVEGGERVVRPMRYQLRPRGKPASFDQRFPGLYNARRDALTGFWREQFGARHGLVVVSSFFENVPRHTYEGRPLAPGERPTHLVIRFTPAPTALEPSPEMHVACLWERWTAPTEPPLLSFAAITDEPPPEVRATGHDRCVVALRPERVSGWLAPEGHGDEALLALLAERAPLSYRHALPGRERTGTDPDSDGDGF